MSRTAAITNCPPCVERAERDLDRDHACRRRARARGRARAPIGRGVGCCGVPRAQLCVTIARTVPGRASRRSSPTSSSVPASDADRPVGVDDRAAWSTISTPSGASSTAWTSRVASTSARTRSTVPTSTGSTAGRRQRSGTKVPCRPARPRGRTATVQLDDHRLPDGRPRGRATGRARTARGERRDRRRRRSGERGRGDRPHSRACGRTSRSSTCAYPTATGSRCAARCAAGSARTV